SVVGGGDAGGCIGGGSAGDDISVWGSIASAVDATVGSDGATGQFWLPGMGNLPRWVTDEKIFATFAASVMQNDPAETPVTSLPNLTPPPPTSTTSDTTANATVVPSTATTT